MLEMETGNILTYTNILLTSIPISPLSLPIISILNPHYPQTTNDVRPISIIDYRLLPLARKRKLHPDRIPSKPAKFFPDFPAGISPTKIRGATEQSIYSWYFDPFYRDVMGDTYCDVSPRIGSFFWSANEVFTPKIRQVRCGKMMTRLRFHWGTPIFWQTLTLEGSIRFCNPFCHGSCVFP